MRTLGERDSTGCMSALEKGHNKRTCPQLNKTNESNANEDHGSTATAGRVFLVAQLIFFINMKLTE